MKRSFLLFSVFFAAFATWAQEKTPQTPPSPPPPIVSPEVHPDNRVVFRLRAPSAKEVTVSIEGSAQPLPMQKDDQGIWSVTSEPLAPDFYGYSFQVDGVGMLDPSNYRIKPNFLYRGNEVHVPGPASLAWKPATFSTENSIIISMNRRSLATTAIITSTLLPATTRVASKLIPFCICFTDTAMTPAVGPLSDAPTWFSTTSSPLAKPNR